MIAIQRALFGASNSSEANMRIGLLFAIVFAIIIGTILWKRGKPPVP
jgi:ABC-type uncharacterized transport system permease subunit